MFIEEFVKSRGGLDNWTDDDYRVYNAFCRMRKMKFDRVSFVGDVLVTTGKYVFPDGSEDQASGNYNFADGAHGEYMAKVSTRPDL